MSDLSHIYAKLHETRFEHVTRARRERELQAALLDERKIEKISINEARAAGLLSFFLGALVALLLTGQFGI